MKKILYILIFAFTPFFFVHAADALPVKNAGFVPSNIWYSKDPFFAGDNVRVYTIIFNGSNYDLTGSVEFLDNNAVIGTTNFALSGNGRVQDVWVDWKSTAGNHVMTARIIDVKASLAGGVKRPIVLDNTETGKSERTVDMDTDKDGVGNTNDIDDDNDTVSDVDELKNGTDPLEADTNNNGISDGKELEIATKQKVEAERLMASSTEPTGSILGTVKKVEDAIPEPIKVGAMLGVSTLESFRVSEGYQIRLAKESKKAELDAMEASTIVPTQKDNGVLGMVSSTSEKPFAYVVYGTLASLQYFFEWQILFYGVLLYLLYRLMKWGIGRWRNRE